ncbi:hypothetical protein M409DRAFT_49949 [Zasmidium cellare ATCC 36951]|uniref:Uncharacterized protein n=1 Tax=Zasmidium cellare ATCC 36951 TaxID=1080233 RepID=A0A6A6CYV4_ZASCE|nr:uncharacterized protein M409DRAFT_49949 [Zasmidium cellare ATCC 36951]KAF2172225.1 hypothetical protein M409DRAFT_49949 [Zasmidium cellare ATCC 36951]
MATIALNSGDKKKWRKTAVCVKSPWTRGTFNKGDVVSLPYHVANMNPERKEDDPGLHLSEFGPVLSKRRMVIILFKYKDIMFCVPLYSFTGRDIESRHPEVIEQYIQLINMYDDMSKFAGKGKYEPIKFRHVHRGQGLNECTTVHITGGKTVSWQEDIELVGRLTKPSYTRLMKLWRDFNDVADDEECSWPS